MENKIDYYNTRIRQAISDKYVECGKRQQEISKKLIELTAKLSRFMDGEEDLTYEEYIDVRSSIGQLQHEEDILDIQRSIWDAARELCLNLAEELEEN